MEIAGTELRAVLSGSSTATDSFKTEAEVVDALRTNRLLMHGVS